ncbi:MAG: C-terminal target protein [Hymenobacter sp.]|nr:C-terminal target protein [Hymenobacter sp.]
MMQKPTPVALQCALSFFMLCLMGLGPLTAQAQAPANDDPCGAVVLTPQGSLCAAATTATNQAATTTAPNGYTNTGSPKDVWFKFTTAASGPASFGATVTVTGNPAGFIQLFASPGGCTGPFSLIDFSPNPLSSGAPNTAAQRLTTGVLTPGTTYYLRVAGFTDADLTGAFTICVADGPGLPTCGAPALGTPTYASTTTATIPVTLGANNTWPLTVLVTGPGSFSQTTTAAASPIQLSGLTQGTTYTVRVTAPCAASGQMAPAVTRSISTPTRYCSTGLGGSCGFSNITDVSIAGTTLTNTSQSPACTTGGYVNFPASGRTTATLQPGTPYSLSVKTANVSATDNVTAWLDYNQNGVYEASESILPVSVASANITRTVSFNVPLNAVAGATGLRVRSLASTFSGLGTGAACTNLIGGETEDYTVTLSAPAACATPTGLAISNLTATSATLSFTPVPGAVNYTVYYGTSFSSVPGSFGNTILVTGSPVQLTGFTPNSASGVSVVTNCGTGSASAPAHVSFNTPQGPPDNDECATATLLVAGTSAQPVDGSSNFGTVSTPAPTPTTACAVPVNQDVWYRFVATQPAHNVVVQIPDQGTILIDAFAGICAGFTRLACTNHLSSPGNLNATVTLPLTNLVAGQTYYVRIGQTMTSTAYAALFSIVVQNPGPGYCVDGLGGSATCAGPNLTNTAIAGTTLNSGAPACQFGAVGSTYTEYGVLGASTATLAAGTTYQLQAAVGSGPADVGLWIDYNQNFVFEASEFTQVGLGVSGSTTVSFTVPAGATLGATRLRLRTTAAGAGLGAATACTAFTTGQTSDFKVTIGAAVPNSCPAPTNVSVTRSSSLPLTGITVAFTAGTPGTTGTTITATPAGGGTPVTATAVSSPYTLTGLTANTSYQVCVASTCAGGGTSLPLVCATASTALPCAAATNLRLTRVGSSGNTYSFAWTGPSNGLGYSVTYTPAGGTPQSVPAPVISPVTVTLLPGVEYTFSVGVDCGFNNGAPLATATSTTLLGTRPAELAALVGLYPNPAHRTATLAVPAALLRQAAELTLLNSVGQVVRRVPVPAARADAQVALDLAHLPAGLYLVQLATGQGPLVKRLVVE